VATCTFFNARFVVLSVRTTDPRFFPILIKCTCEIKCRIAMAKAAFNKKRTLFTSTLDLEIEEETSEVLHLEHSFIWC
jgi:hypothetical protein